MICIDPHPVAKNWVHWLLFDLPGSSRELAAEQSRTNRLDNGARQGLNSYGDTGWGGPQPPPGTGDHPYIFTLYALDIHPFPVETELPSIEEVQNAMEGHILGEATYTGFYSQ